MQCPCGSQKTLEQCCGPLIDGEIDAETPEALMRSRYTAFATKKLQYLIETTDPQTSSQFDWKANEDWANSAKFLGLEILKSTMDGNKGTVEFKATFQINGEPEEKTHHEFSKFRKQAGIWYFREGRMRSET